MARTVNLDAMITRSDFASKQDAESSQSNNFAEIALKDLAGHGAWLPKLLRKPDFQRETTQWTSSQITTLIESFLDGELIPAVILWGPKSHIFVIDGGHRLSALLAWVLDDYGDGPHSYQYFGGMIPNAQRVLARKTRAEIETKIGPFSHFAKQISEGNDNVDPKIAGRIGNFVRRGLQVQWIYGDADKAESSFFKINTQGSVLDPVEGRILRNRRKAPAIAARSVVRAGTGHQYWSKFDENVQGHISAKATSIHLSLFAPEINTPIKSIDLPIGGSSSVTDALDMLINLCEIVDSDNKSIEKYEDDIDGSDTVKLLNKLESVTSNLVGNQSKSLGIHPFVYFYTSKGRHYPPLMMGMFALVSEKIKNNDREWFKIFASTKRRDIEQTLIEHKTIITLLISALASARRANGGKKVLEYIIESVRNDVRISADEIAQNLGLESRLYSIQSKPGTDFSEDAKSSAFLREALKQALKCPLCHGYLDPAKSISYDHIKRKSEGGNGSDENCQPTHPYCNSIKN
ncbi:DUF262 domain-containing protein [Blastomonas sp. AAP25]|uniref:GmrSD restriction endonuclease domain-containing protein n=1 Tax=Blastomonas sp. AAP25 TaxID=1523416 RepID=UPI0009EAAFF9|nr:DUF262 domain-containing protein [Blastomonas sp. AAP25]